MHNFSQIKNFITRVMKRKVLFLCFRSLLKYTHMQLTHTWRERESERKRGGGGEGKAREEDRDKNSQIKIEVCA